MARAKVSVADQLRDFRGRFSKMFTDEEKVHLYRPEDELDDDPNFYRGVGPEDPMFNTPDPRDSDPNFHRGVGPEDPMFDRPRPGVDVPDADGNWDWKAMRAEQDATNDPGLRRVGHVGAATHYVTETRNASAEDLERDMGYTREQAEDVLGHLEAAGVIGPKDPETGKHEVKMTSDEGVAFAQSNLDDWRAQRDRRARAERERPRPDDPNFNPEGAEPSPPRVDPDGGTGGIPRGADRDGDGDVDADDRKLLGDVPSMTPREARAAMRGGMGRGAGGMGGAGGRKGEKEEKGVVRGYLSLFIGFMKKLT